MCKPQRIKDKVIGGYARICPLCGAKVHTELTGMRLYKYKDSDDVFEFICCPTCYENLRYSMLWLLAKSFARCKTSRASNTRHPIFINDRGFVLTGYI